MRISKLRLGEISKKLRKGEMDPENFTNEVCDRVESWDKDIRALLPEKNRRERMLSEVATLKERYPDPKKRPLLYGVPVGVKDLFRVDGFETRAGSLLHPDLFAGKEASAVKKLKQAGAVILGKTVTTEFAYFEPGPTRNPHNLEHTPGGSSSGSAAAVAAGFCPVAFGTQTIGSITRPAAYCGVFGFKPSFARITPDGVVSFSVSADHVGFFTQDMEGMEICASILCKSWNKKKQMAAMIPEDKRSHITIGIPVGKYLEQATPEALKFFEEQVREIEDRGHFVRRVELFPDIEEINITHRRMIASEISTAHKDIFDANRPLFRLGTQQIILEGRDIPKNLVSKAINGRTALRMHIANKSKEMGIDVWLTPATTGTAPQGISSTGSPIMNLPWTYAGVPTITMPVGRAVNGLPMALQFAGNYMDDENLISIVKIIATEAEADNLLIDKENEHKVFVLLNKDKPKKAKK